VSFVLAGRNINEGKLEITCLSNGVLGPTVTYDLVIFSLAGTWLGQSPLHAILHCIIKSFLIMRVADEVESAEAGLEPCWTNQAYTFLVFMHIFWASVRQRRVQGQS
jgi:hypothetical protein